MKLAEWQAEMERRGAIECKFRCPLCGNEASPKDWKEADGDPQRAARECIGRLVGAKGRLGSDPPVPQPCDWAAFGLFGTLNEGTKVELEDGKVLMVFDFAEAAA